MTSLVRAISLWQPWASLWLSPRKIHETRHWPTTYRGPLAVHAAKRIEKRLEGHPLLDILTEEYGSRWAVDLPSGALIGVVELTDCKPTESIPRCEISIDDFHCGDFSPGRYAWKRGGFRLLQQPVPYTGRQGFFNVPAELLA